MSVGFPGFTNLNRKTIRGPINPLDKSTVVSIYPKDIVETKVTLTPGQWRIKAGSYESPSILVIGPSSWWRDIDEEQPLLEIPVSSIQIADSIVKDYCNGIFGCDMGQSMPGLFYIPGQLTISEVRKSYQHELERAKQKQLNFFSVLIRMADSLWARSNGNPLAISDDMRLAAHELGLKDKDWMKDFRQVEMERCKLCGSFKSPLYPVCSTCKGIDQNHPDAKNIKFAS